MQVFGEMQLPMYSLQKEEPGFFCFFILLWIK